MVINEDFKLKVGRRLKELRNKNKLTIGDLIEKLQNEHYIDIDEKSIRRYEKGEFLPKIDNLICLTEIFNTSLDYIIYGIETSDDNSFTWYDNFKRLNRLLYTMQILMLRDEEKKGDIYLKLLDNEAKEWFGRIERFIENKRLMFDSNGIEKEILVKDMDALFEDFQNDHTQLCPIEERVRRQFVALNAEKPVAIVTTKEEDGELIVTAKIQKK